MPVGPFFADFLCRQAKLTVELDGYSHDLSFDADAVRDRWLRDAGYKVIRFRNEDVLNNVEGVVDRVGRVLADGPTPDPSRKRGRT